MTHIPTLDLDPQLVPSPTPGPGGRCGHGAESALDELLQDRAERLDPDPRKDRPAARTTCSAPRAAGTKYAAEVS